MSFRSTMRHCVVVASVAVLAGAAATPFAAGRQAAPGGGKTVPRVPQAKTAASAPTPVDAKAVIDRYCVGCHNQRLKTAELVLEDSDYSMSGADTATWERVVQKLHASAMPPAGVRRPDAATMRGLIAALEGALDRAALATPNPGRPPLHRLNRLEYGNVIRDIFGLAVDAKTLLPADDTGYGFDNIADVLTISPGLLERYMIAATKISRLVVGDAGLRPVTAVYDVPYLALDQRERMSDALPFGSRGGLAITHYFPLDGEYKLRFTLQGNDLASGNGTRGLGVANEIDIRLDRRRLHLFSVGGRQAAYRGYDVNRDLNFSLANGYDEANGLEVTFRTTAGSHVIGVTFNRDAWDMEGVSVSQLPFTNFGFAQPRDTTQEYGRVDMGLEQMIITGPFNGSVSADSDVRRRLFVCTPATAAAETPCARRILGRVARLAFRRPVADQELETLMDFYTRGRAKGSFDAGVESALVRLLVDLNFLFRPEHDPVGVTPGRAYRLSDLELASRLSFFLWSSGPDDELMTVATQGRLRAPDVLEQQVKRMLADPRADVMVGNFFGQWLTTKNLVNQRPDGLVYPVFDENLRQAFLKETDLFLQSQVREDRPIPELLRANYTFVNERLAQHYGIPGVRGERFRRVVLPDDTRGGLLGHGSVLTVTSYNDRTSVVMRGKWIMDTILGTPPPPPPANVPPLSDVVVKGTLRQRMELHRKNPVCAACHTIIDPLGFALENFDGVGQYRSSEGGVRIDPSGSLADGSKFDGPAAYRKVLVTRQAAFLTTLTRQLVTYALGRGVETYDMPAVRTILRDAASNDYRWFSVILGIVKSTPFQMRRAVS